MEEGWGRSADGNWQFSQVCLGLPARCAFCCVWYSVCSVCSLLCLGCLSSALSAVFGVLCIPCILCCVWVRLPNAYSVFCCVRVGQLCCGELCAGGEGVESVRKWWIRVRSTLWDRLWAKIGCHGRSETFPCCKWKWHAWYSPRHEQIFMNSFLIVITNQWNSPYTMFFLYRSIILV